MATADTIPTSPNLEPDAAEKDRAAWRLLRAQIAHFQRSERWGPWKALAAIIAGVALMTAAVIALSNWRQPQTITVNFGQPLQVQLQPAPGK